MVAIPLVYTELGKLDLNIFLSINRTSDKNSLISLELFKNRSFY